LKNKSFRGLVSENQSSGQQLLDRLLLVQAEENIIKCDDILLSLEETLNNYENVVIITY
jgi:hypothetical protein